MITTLPSSYPELPSNYPDVDSSTSSPPNYSNSSSNNSAYGNWFSRTFDPQGAEMRFNSAQAELERKWNAEQATIAYNRNSAEAQKQRVWEEGMSNTAYQRAVKDLRSAGLNPYLMYGGASASSTPTGSSATAPSATGSSARVGGAQSLIGTIVNSAFSLAARAIPSRSVRSNYYYWS